MAPEDLRIRAGICCLFVIMKTVKLQLKDKGFMGLFLISAFLAFVMLPRVSGNAEGDALNALKKNLADPNNVLQDWDPAQDNPCRWSRVTCNFNNSVTRVDLGEKNLSGKLVPQLGQLPNLQYLELYSNNITGEIPEELGNLTNLVSLDLYFNKLTGPIPDTLGNLEKLGFLRLNNNILSGNIPMTLTNIASLLVILKPETIVTLDDLSNNQLTGYIPANGSFALFTPTSFANNPGLKTQKLLPTPPPSERGLSSSLSSGPAKEISPPPSPSVGNYAASSVLPTSAASLLLPLIIAIFSGF